MEINQFIDESSVNQLKAHLNSKNTQSQLMLKLHEGAYDGAEAISASIQTFDSENERFLSLFLHRSSPDDSVNTQSLLSNLTKELAENRQRMEQIESTLGQLNTVEVNKQPELSVSSKDVSEGVDSKELIVKTLRTALITWERYTHKTKADLAEESHCWRVYIDGATAKTRTLDKYLSVKTLPAKPRWRAVIKTANYVLDHCEMSEEDLNELYDLVQEVNTAYS